MFPWHNFWLLCILFCFIFRERESLKYPRLALNNLCNKRWLWISYLLTLLPSAGIVDVHHHSQYVWYWESVFLLGRHCSNEATFPFFCLFFLNPVFQCCSFTFAHCVGHYPCPHPVYTGSLGESTSFSTGLQCWEQTPIVTSTGTTNEGLVDIPNVDWSKFFYISSPTSQHLSRNHAVS